MAGIIATKIAPTESYVPGNQSKPCDTCLRQGPNEAWFSSQDGEHTNLGYFQEKLCKEERTISELSSNHIKAIDAYEKWRQELASNRENLKDSQHPYSANMEKEVEVPRLSPFTSQEKFILELYMNLRERLLQHQRKQSVKGASEQSLDFLLLGQAGFRLGQLMMEMIKHIDDHDFNTPGNINIVVCEADKISLVLNRTQRLLPTVKNAPVEEFSLKCRTFQAEGGLDFQAMQSECKVLRKNDPTKKPVFQYLAGQKFDILAQRQVLTGEPGTGAVVAKLLKQEGAWED